MFRDTRTTFVTNTAVGAATGTELVGDVIDLETARNIGRGNTVFVTVVVTESFDSATDGAEVEFQLASDAAAAIATDGTASVHGSSGPIPELSLQKGNRAVLAFAAGPMAFERYVGLLAVTSGEAVTAGKVTAFIAFDDDAPWEAMPDGND